MGKQKWVGLLILLSTTVALAQPPEEVPPPLPEGSESIIVPAPAPAPIPVAEPKLAAPAVAPEDKRLKGIELSPSLRISPYGYDNIGVSGEEGQRHFLGVKPELGFSSAFKTATNKTIDLSLAYSMEWREYFNKAGASRDFDNNVSGTLGIEWNKLLKTTLYTEFDYFFKVGSDLAGDNSILLDMVPTMNFTVTKELGLKLGYYLRFANVTSAMLGAGDFYDVPSDPDEMRRGGPTSDVSGYDNLTGLPGESTRWFENRLTTGVSYKFSTGTKINFDYWYLFSQVSNARGQYLTGHFITPSISQPLPWKGGNITLKDELRLRKYEYSKAGDTDVARQNFRNRLTGTVTQEINDYMSSELFYRLELRGENRDDYSEIARDHLFYLGMIFKF